eukprot:SAG31_NODE_3156_length_4610_cov_12.728663_1_plen_184_part_00
MHPAVATDARLNDGSDALYLATTSGHQKVAEFLVELEFAELAHGRRFCPDIDGRRAFEVRNTQIRYTVPFKASYDLRCFALISGICIVGILVVQTLERRYAYGRALDVACRMSRPRLFAFLTRVCNDLDPCTLARCAAFQRLSWIRAANNDDGRTLLANDLVETVGLLHWWPSVRVALAIAQC